MSVLSPRAQQAWSKARLMGEGEPGSATVSVMIQFTSPIAVAREDLLRVRDFYEQGDCLGAYEIASTIGPLTCWSGTAARVLAGRLAGHLGAPRLGMALHVKAWREDPTDPEACYYHARTMLGRQGPLPTWEFLSKVGPLEGAPDVVRADWLATHALALGGLRDFDAAEQYMALADGIAPERAWLWVERSALLQMEDLYDRALDAAETALTLWAWYRPAVQQKAGLLQLMDCEAEAVEFLAEASARVKSGVIAAQLACLQYEIGRYNDAVRSLDWFATLSPLIDKPTRSWLAGRRSDAAYRLGDLAAAASFARASGESFFLTLADRIEAAGADSRRVRLAVGFVRQHHQTCAPATLAALARYWGRDIDHLEVASEICYDGTADHRGRSWAEENGWAAREFTVTWDSAVALLDRGIPFTLTTVEPQSAHLQAVIGYDARRGTLLIRDPTLPYDGEALAGPFLDRHRSVGPRGMALIPCDRAGLLDGLELLESALYDQVYALQVALRKHDRAAAATAFESLLGLAPRHRLAHHARWLLASYDADTPAQQAAIEALRAAFPEDVNLRLTQLSYLRELGRRDDRLALYREFCRGPSPDPILSRQYAQELLADAREHPCAERLARRVLRTRPFDAASLFVLARVAWDAGRRAQALQLYRFASCLDDKDEGLARAYFSAARHLHREDEPLHFLTGRFRRLGARSSLPARTLHWGLMELERATEAAAVLQRALELRPDDGELLLYAAQSEASVGEFARAGARLDEARGHCRLGDWLRAAANLASNRGELTAALGLWRQVLDSEPAALDANRAAARLLAQTEGRPAALRHLTQACAQSKHNYALQRTLIEWIGHEQPAEAEPAVLHLLEIHPADAWGHRELALVQSEQNRHEDAATELEIAAALEPSSTAEAAVRGFVLKRAGHLARAREAFREAIRRDVDNEWAIDRLIETCDSHAERLEALAFVESELERQVIFGDGLLAFARPARGTLGSDGLLATLMRALEARPDLWHAWSALVHERIERGELEEAHALARRAVERFPLLPKLWLDLAAVCRARGDGAGERDALGRALRINPGWGWAARELSLALEREQKYEESRTILERAAAYAPLDPYNHGCLAETLWHLGEKEAAMERIVRSLRLDPGYDWAWTALSQWAIELKRNLVPAELARELARERPGDRWTWMALARILHGQDALDERLAAVDRAVALDPYDFKPHDLKAEMLAEAGKYEAALAACQPPCWGDRPPHPLRGRAAWVVARRGDIAAAIALMRPVLAENPDYAWGWRHFAQWAREAGTKEEYLASGEALVRLQPEDAVSHEYHGEARFRNGDRAGAKESYRRALALSPSHRFAPMNLFDLELADKELEAAKTPLAALRTHDGDNAFVIAREVQWHVAQGDRAAALEALGRLCVANNTTSEWPFRTAEKALTEVGWGKDADLVYAKALECHDAAPLIGAIWAEHWTSRRTWRVAHRLRSLLASGGEAAHRALAVYVNALGNARAGLRLWLCIWQHRDALRSRTLSWGYVGFALLNIGHHRATTRWLGDWAVRENVQPWMLINLVLSLRHLGRDADAGRVSRHALELPADHCTAHHQIWLALDELSEGRAGIESARLDTIDPEKFRPTHRYLYELAMALRDVLRAEPAARRSAALAARRNLIKLNRKTVIPAGNLRAVLRAYRRALAQIVRPLGRGLGSIVLIELMVMRFRSK